MTNAVAVVPGYLGGSIGYRRELAGQGRRALALACTCAVGAAGGAILLLVTTEALFAAVVPYLVLGSSALLAAQPLLARAVRAPGAGTRSLRLHASTFAASVYGGYFGAGLGILLLAVLELSIDDGVQRLNALKGLLSLAIGLVAAACFTILAPVQWGPAALMAATGLLGGQVGVGLARRLDDGVLRWLVVAFGLAVGLALLIG